MANAAVTHDQYKDRLFSFLFGREENKAWTLDLYNAVNGSHYTDPAAITITTIRQVLYMSMHNDVSFLISDYMSLYEQQSTYNPNMPVRQLQYSGYVYERYIKDKGLNKYGRKRIRLPVPKLVVFYNGTSEQPEEEIQELKDSFPPGAESDIDVRVRVININYGRNKKLLDACKPLGEYAWFIAEIRNNKKHMEVDAAVDQAITAMPADCVIKPFLESHRAEVMGMMLMEYNEAETMNMFKEEGREEGREEGIEIGRVEGREEGRVEGRAEGRAEGRVEGREELASLICFLLQEGRIEDVKKATTDSEFQKQLLEDYSSAQR